MVLTVLMMSSMRDCELETYEQASHGNWIRCNYQWSVSKVLCKQCFNLLCHTAMVRSSAGGIADDLVGKT